jgi:MFS family permease
MEALTRTWAFCSLGYVRCFGDLATLTLIGFIALWTSIGSMMLGLDNIVGSQILAVDAFKKQYGIPYSGTDSGYLVPASWQSYWAAASQAGDFFGAICASYLLEKIGRKPNVLISAILTSIGIGIQIASVEWKLYLVGRLINGEFRLDLFPSFTLTDNRCCHRYHVHSLASVDWGSRST